MSCPNNSLDRHSTHVTEIIALVTNARSGSDFRSPQSQPVHYCINWLLINWRRTVAYLSWLSPNRRHLPMAAFTQSVAAPKSRRGLGERHILTGRRGRPPPSGKG